jgi:hypothetical protein
MELPETAHQKQNFITIDFSELPPSPTTAQRIPTDDGIDSVMKNWQAIGLRMRIDQAMAYLVLSLQSDFLGDDDAVEREIKKRCKWLPEWLQWKKNKKRELGTDQVTFKYCCEPFRVEVEVEYPEWRIHSGKSAIQGADDETRWAIEGILQENGGVLDSGLPHATKSMTMLCAGLECVTTRRVWGKFRVSESVRNVVFVETEDSEAMVKRRLKGLCKGLGIPHPPYGFHLVRPGPFSLIGEGEERLREIIKKTHADILILSTLQGLINGADWKEQKDMAPINAIFVRLQELCSLIVITHSPWNEKRAAGSVTQAANFSTLMHFEKRTDADGVTVTHVALDSKESGEEQTFDLELQVVRTGESSTQVRRVCYREHAHDDSAANSDLKDKALGLRSDGYSIREIARMLRVSKTTLGRWFKECK